MSRRAPPLRTYSHLGASRKVPSEYDIVTSRLLYYVERGFEVDVPVGPFFARHQRGCPLRSVDWEGFRDPRATTYSDYTARQTDKEIHLEALLRSAESQSHASSLDPEWRSTLEGILGPVRFAIHGFQMMAAYLGHIAPAGRLTLVAMFQAADHKRAIDGLSLWLAQLSREPANAAGAARRRWLEDPAWQPLRRAVELGLVAYDWGESLVALDLGLSPWLDHLLTVELAAQAREQRDFFTAEILSSFESDSRWHREWTAAFVDHLRQDAQAGRQNLEYLARKQAHWRPLARAAATGAAGAFGQGGDRALAATEQAMRRWESTLFEASVP